MGTRWSPITNRGGAIYLAKSKRDKQFRQNQQASKQTQQADQQKTQFEVSEALTDPQTQRTKQTKPDKVK